MANPQPIVCVFLKFPPQEQIFSRIGELAETFVNKVDQLTMAVAASHSANTSPVAVQAVDGLRRGAANHCSELSRAVYNAHKFAIIYLSFMHNLSSLEVSEQTFMDIHHVHVDASVEIKKTTTAREVMVQFKRDVTDVVTRIKEALKDDDDSKEVFTAENGQAVTELFQAIDECNDLLQQVSDFHADMKAQTEYGKDQEIRSCMPSEGEVTMMQERWTSYLNNVEAVNRSFDDVIRKLRSAEGIKKADDLPNHHSSGEAVPPASMSNPADEVDGRKLIASAETTGPPLAKRKVSFWRSLMQSIYSCLTFKCFR